jgi:hypothetical protein
MYLAFWVGEVRKRFEMAWEWCVLATNQPPRMIRGIPLRHSRAILSGWNQMVLLKETHEKLSNIELTIIVIAAFITLAVLFVPVR